MPAELNIIYKQLKNLQSQLPDLDLHCREIIVNNYNKLIDNLSSLTQKDYSYLKLGNGDIVRTSTGWNDGQQRYYVDSLKANLGLAIGALQGELNIDDDTDIGKNIINIINQNKNAVAVDIKQTVNQLLEQETDEDIKKKLKELQEAITNKDKSKLGQILKWLIDKGLIELLIKVLPEILKVFY